MPKGFLDSRTVNELRGYVGQGLQTAKDLVPVSISLIRLDQESGTPTTLPQRTVRFRFAGLQSAPDTGESTVQQADSGSIRDFVPFDVRAGDTFVYGGQRYVITNVFPERYGAIEATFERWSGRA